MGRKGGRKRSHCRWLSSRRRRSELLDLSVLDSWLPQKRARATGKCFYSCYCALSVIVLLVFFFVAPSINKSALCV
ncbi:Vicilin-like seed storage protein, partial [Zea mays]